MWPSQINARARCNAQRNGIASGCSLYCIYLVTWLILSYFHQFHIYVHKNSVFFPPVVEVLLIKHVNHYRQITKEISTIATQFVCLRLKRFKWKSNVCAPSITWRKSLEIKTTLKQPNKYARNFGLCRRQYFFTCVWIGAHIFQRGNFLNWASCVSRRKKHSTTDECNPTWRIEYGRALASFRTHFLSHRLCIFNSEIDSVRIP